MLHCEGYAEKPIAVVVINIYLYVYINFRSVEKFNMFNTFVHVSFTV